MSAQLPQPQPQPSASHPGWIRRDYDFVKNAADNDSAFRLSLVGTSLYFLATIAIATTLALTVKNTRVILPVIFLLAGSALFVGLSLWNNYCLVYGKCKDLAFGFGVFYLIDGVAAVIMALVFAFNAKKYGAILRQIYSK